MQRKKYAQQAHRFDPMILREYDIRGLVDKNLSEEDAYALGRAFGTYVIRKYKGKKICVGYDGRKSSPVFAAALIDGLVQTGLDIDNVGLGPSPMLYFAVKDHKADAGIMITGSHNPAAYNGFKMVLQNAAVYGAMIQEIGKIAALGDFEKGKGSAREIDVKDAYVERLLKDFSGTRDLKIAWDNGNGAAGEILRRLTAKLPGEHILLYDEIDGTFPHHHPDPTIDKNLADLRETVLTEECDLGIAFDGDGDRIGVVNEKGGILRCDILMTLYAAEVLKNNPGAPIIADVKCSKVLFDEIARLGGKPVMWKTGNSLIKTKMAGLKAPLAGELSGHIFFADKYYGFDDGLYCAVRLINIVAASGPLSFLTTHLPRLYNTPEIRFEVDEAEKFSLVPKIAASIRKQGGGEHIDDIDGLRVTNKDGWWIIRPSNTQNALSARAESDSPEGLKRLKDKLVQEVAKIGYKLNFEQEGDKH
jgi:phosphomannomutase